MGINYAKPTSPRACAQVTWGTVMTEDEKQALRDSFTGKPVSQMTPDERKVFDADFQYGFGNAPVKNQVTTKAALPKILPTSTLKFLQRMGLAQKK